MPVASCAGLSGVGEETAAGGLDATFLNAATRVRHCPPPFAHRCSGLARAPANTYQSRDARVPDYRAAVGGRWRLATYCSARPTPSLEPITEQCGLA